MVMLHKYSTFTPNCTQHEKELDNSYSIEKIFTYCFNNVWQYSCQHHTTVPIKQLQFNGIFERNIFMEKEKQSFDEKV